MPSMVKYNNCLKQQMNGGGGTAALVIDYDTDTIKISLHTSSYVPDAAAHTVFSDLTNEVSGTNYTAGGVTLTGKTVTESAGVITFDADNISIAQSVTGFADARYAVMRKDSGVDGTSPLIGYYDLLTDQANTVIPFSLVFDALGILTWS